jgi:hypothetical protein
MIASWRVRAPVPKVDGAPAWSRPFAEASFLNGYALPSGPLAVPLPPASRLADRSPLTSPGVDAASGLLAELAASLAFCYWPPSPLVADRVGSTERLPLPVARMFSASQSLGWLFP